MAKSLKREIMRALAVVERSTGVGAEQNGFTSALPQEDMCQTFGLPSSVKYESDGGRASRGSWLLMGSNWRRWKIAATDLKFRCSSGWLAQRMASKTSPVRPGWRQLSTHAILRHHFSISRSLVAGNTPSSDLKTGNGFNDPKAKTQSIKFIRDILATAKVLRIPEGWSWNPEDFARMIPAALDNVKTSLPTDFPENVVTAVETNVLRLHGRLKPRIR